MENKTGKITAVAPTAATGEDASLPDPTLIARIFLGVCVVLAFLVAVVANWQDWATQSFEPAKVEEANFALFAGFYIGAQLIERLMELASPILPLWGLPAGFPDDPKAKVAQVKADRAKAVLGLATLLGVILSAAFGLYFLDSVGMNIPRMPDIFFTGLIIAAGTKPLHDFISGLQKKGGTASGSSTSV
jgi:hypothetical protein